MNNERQYGVAFECLAEHGFHNRYYLSKDGNVVRTRMRQFKRAWWLTRDGARAAADKLNANIISNAGVPGTTEFA